MPDLSSVDQFLMERKSNGQLFDEIIDIVDQGIQVILFVVFPSFLDHGVEDLASPESLKN